MTDSLERRTKFSPNPNETFPPATAQDAFEDFFRYQASLSSRKEVGSIVEGLDSARIAQIALAVRGEKIERPLSAFELMVGNTLQYCIQTGLLRSPAQFFGAFGSAKLDLLRGNVFVGQERTPKITTP